MKITNIMKKYPDNEDVQWLGEHLKEAVRALFVLRGAAEADPNDCVTRYIIYKELGGVLASIGLDLSVKIPEDIKE